MFDKAKNKEVLWDLADFLFREEGLLPSFDSNEVRINHNDFEKFIDELNDVLEEKINDLKKITGSSCLKASKMVAILFFILYTNIKQKHFFGISSINGLSKGIGFENYKVKFIKSFVLRYFEARCLLEKSLKNDEIKNIIRVTKNFLDAVVNGHQLVNNEKNKDGENFAMLAILILYFDNILEELDRNKGQFSTSHFLSPLRKFTGKK